MLQGEEQSTPFRQPCGLRNQRQGLQSLSQAEGKQVVPALSEPGAWTWLNMHKPHWPTDLELFEGHLLSNEMWDARLFALTLRWVAVETSDLSMQQSRKWAETKHMILNVVSNVFQTINNICLICLSTFSKRFKFRFYSESSSCWDWLQPPNWGYATPLGGDSWTDLSNGYGEGMTDISWHGDLNFLETEHTMRRSLRQNIHIIWTAYLWHFVAPGQNYVADSRNI